MFTKKALAASASAAKVYVEDVFSTYLYTGDDAIRSINNGINLAGKGGAVWFKARNQSSFHTMFDTARGANNYIFPNQTDGQNSYGAINDILTAFNNNGFTLGADGLGGVNGTGDIQVSWTFRKAEKFFDVVTYTGTGSNRTVAHNLGSVPGCIIVKRTDTTGAWQVYHRSLSINSFLSLNSSNGITGTSLWNSTSPTSTVFSLGTDASVNANGGTYVAYLFAHDAGGFGDSGNDNVISCGSYTGNGSATGPVVTLGWEPQWLLVKRTDTTGAWVLLDTMRALVARGPDRDLSADSNSAENSASNRISPLSAGFQLNNTSTDYNANGSPYIYIAIRRGPMKTPTDATAVFQSKLYTGTNVDNRLVTTDILTDMVWVRQLSDTVLGGMVVGDRMRGQQYLRTGEQNVEVNDADSFDAQIVSSVEYGNAFSSMTGFWVGNDITSKLNANTTSDNHVALAFRRAPGFFDVVAYTGTGSARTVSHNLGVVPELIIIKNRSGTNSWLIYCGFVPAPIDQSLILDSTAAVSTNVGTWKTPTTTTFGMDISFSEINSSASNYIAYLFATCPGVSKVGSYTGTGTTLDIDCGFTNGARFVLIKRTDSTGDWFVWDTARGIVSGNDPYLLLNSTAAEVTNTDYIDPLSSGFQISSTAPAAINASGGSFIFLAIA
jgi:hypothetical protein